MFVPITGYTLAAHDGPYADWPLTTPLLLDGEPTGSAIPGYVIEGQYRWRDFVLLITSWDCPFEEACDIVLLDGRHTMVAQTSLCVPYGSFLLHAHWPIDDVSLRLHFYRKDSYTLSVQEPAFLRPRHRLRLRRHVVTPGDERTRASVRALEEQLEALERTPE